MYPASPARVQLQELIRRLLNQLVGALIEGTRDAAESYGSVEDVRRAPERLARLTPAMADLNLRIKRFLHQRVYHSAALAEERERGARRISELFGHFLAHPGDLPEEYRRTEELPRAVCDFIAGMTEGYFERTYVRCLS
jgi:dGTPase